MPTKAWNIVLDGRTHYVELEYTWWDAREKLTVNGEVLSDEARWTMASKYDFELDGRACHLVLYSMPYEGKLTVDGKPAEMLPCNVLLRSAGEEPESLLRPAVSESEPEADKLVRPAEQAPN